MSTALVERELVFKVVHFAAGSGFGALGFKRGRAIHGRVRARFETLFGIDVDPVACRDFERLVGAPCYALDLFTREQYTLFHGRPPPEDWVELTGEMIRALSGGVFPDAAFTSTPCKVLSSLTSAALASDPAYQQLNELLPRSVELMLDAWGDDPPALFILENVPRLGSGRGRHLLDRAKLLLELHGYAVAETMHDCGELGGLAQHRKRFLLVARHRKKVKPYLYEPSRRPVRGVGEVIGRLPYPDDAQGHPLHTSPRCQWKTWLRLALVEAGSDWRSLNKLDVADGFVRGLRLVPEHALRNGAFGVTAWNDPCGTLTGEGYPSNGPFSVADPRSPRNLKKWQPYGIVPWQAPAPTLTGEMAPGAGSFSVVDPRVGGFDGQRQPYNDVWKVVRWDEAAGAITGGGTPSAGGQSVADPRVRCKREGEDFSGAHHYGVLRWAEPSPTITGHACYDNGAHSVADPRPMPAPGDYCLPWIWSLDSTRHRPFTKLEQAALQGYPIEDILQLQLEGSDALIREHVGNAVPVASAEAISSTFLDVLLRQAAGVSFDLSAAPIWVNPQIALALSVDLPVEGP